jgi:hypothetical protein
VIPVAEVRDALGVGAEHDTTLARLIQEATAALGRALGRYLGSPVERREVKCGGTVVFLVDDPTDEEVTVETRPSAFDQWEAVDIADVVVEGREVWTRHGFPAGGKTVRVTYMAGYAIGEGPEELRGLVLDLVKLKWNERGAVGLMKSETLGDYSYTRGDMEKLASWGEVVNHWRRRLA